MTELRALLNESPALAFFALCFAGFSLWTLCESLGKIGRRTTTIHHHHHGPGCDDDHEEGPCETKS